MSIPMSGSPPAASLSSVFREWSYAEQWQSHMEQCRHSHLHNNNNNNNKSTSIIQGLVWLNDDKGDRLLLFGCTRQGDVCAWHVLRSDTNPGTSSSTNTAPVWRLDVGIPLYAMLWSMDHSQLCVAGQGGVLVLDGTKILEEIRTKHSQKKSGSDAASASSSFYILTHLATHANAQTTPIVTDLCVCRDAKYDAYIYYGAARHDAFGAYQWTTQMDDHPTKQHANIVVRTIPATSGGHDGTSANVTSLDLYGSVLVTGDSAGVVRLWDTSTMGTATTASGSPPQQQRDVRVTAKPIQTLPYTNGTAGGGGSTTSNLGDKKRPVLACRFWKSSSSLSAGNNQDSPDWLVVAYGGDPNNHTTTTTATSQLVMWHLPSESCVASADTASSITCLYVSQTHIYTGANDGRVTVWTPFDLKCQFGMTTSALALYAMALSSSNDSSNSDSKHLAVAGVGATVELWDEHGLLKHRLQL
eukprot:scaffold3471_cov175-Amphora_coffeaeformis.AAC.17